MITSNILKNSLAIIKIYLPNIFKFISDADFEKFLIKAFNHTEANGGGTPNNNFIVTFFKLVEEHAKDNSNVIRNEFGYFNHLIGKFAGFSNSKNFKDLILASINNFESSNFKHALGESAACLDLSQSLNFLKYEKVLENGKSLDFEFENSLHSPFYFDVVNIDFDKNRYEKEHFKKFLDGRLSQKFESKSENLPQETKEQIFIYPILYGFNVEIVKEQKDYLESLSSATILSDGFQCCAPKSFGIIQGTFFSLMSVDQICNPEKHFK